ncbi:hypothetical protein Mgra_00003741 [Meloidogyne graminicola]|uniref:Uncharacterized protein n=1 Tax=Meloidogyne graminicola TaxID=189291 RepID=A0A8S9ZTH6_9BILA|nr:hypothetical protein Mgra_00003741 [Meloidogyne graminicola]
MTGENNDYIRQIEEFNYWLDKTAEIEKRLESINNEIYTLNEEKLLKLVEENNKKTNKNSNKNKSWWWSSISLISNVLNIF